MFGLNEVLVFYSFYRWLKLFNSRAQKCMAKPRPGYVLGQIWSIFGQDFVLPKQRALLEVLGVKGRTAAVKKQDEEGAGQS